MNKVATGFDARIFLQRWRENDFYMCWGCREPSLARAFAIRPGEFCATAACPLCAIKHSDPEHAGEMLTVLRDVRWPARVIRWSNGMLMTFDQHGEQMPGLQGMADDENVCARIRAAARPATSFEGGDRNSGAGWPLSASECLLA